MSPPTWCWVLVAILFVLGLPPYTLVLDCVRSVLRDVGVFLLWLGLHLTRLGGMQILVGSRTNPNELSLEWGPVTLTIDMRERSVTIKP